MKKLMLLLSLFAVIPAVATVDVYDPDWSYYGDDYHRGSYVRSYSREECPGGVCPRRSYYSPRRVYRSSCPGGRCPRRVYRSEFYPRYYREEAPVVVETTGMAYPYGDGYWGPKYVEHESKETLGQAYPYGDGVWGPKVVEDNDND